MIHGTAGGARFENVAHPTMHASEVQRAIVTNKGKCRCGNETLNGARTCGVCIMAERRAVDYIRENGVDVVAGVPRIVERKSHHRRG